ncbi:retrovirus-related Pol polyprotein from transposon 297 [Trichonephila clavipes]|nr:retrovirus-related Pol polyprotein from transposon 297 [Trichonephila clavipes]
MAARLLHGRLLFTFQTLIKIEIFFQSRPLHRRSIHAEFKPLHRLNEVSEKWRSVSSQTLLFIVQTLVQNRNFIDRGRAPIICGRQQGVQDFCLSYGLFNIKQKLIKKVDKFDNDMRKFTALICEGDCNVVTPNGDQRLLWTLHSHVHPAAADKRLQHGRPRNPFLTPEESNSVDRKMKERCFELTREQWPNDSSSRKLLDSSKGKKQDLLQLAEELGINATLNITAPSIKIAITNNFDPKQSDINLYLVIFKRQAKRASIEKKEWVGQLLGLLPLEIVQFIARESEEQVKNYDYVKKLLFKRFKLNPEVFRQKFVQHQKKSDSTWKDFTFEIMDYLDEWLIGLEINTFQDLKDLMVVDQLKKRANASMKDHFLDNWANLKSATQIAELFDNYEDVRKGSVNGQEIDILRDTGAAIDLVCAKYINPSSFSGENVWVKQPLSPELVCLPLAVVEISENFGTVQTKAAVCGNHLNQHGRYFLGNKTAELIKENLGYNFLSVELINAVRQGLKSKRLEK